MAVQTGGFMSFLTERYFQLLDDHPIYDRLVGRGPIQAFMEAHVFCVFGYQQLLRSIHRDLMGVSQTLHNEAFKEAFRIMHEIVLEEELDFSDEGRIVSHLELYLEAMREMDCDLSWVFGFLDDWERHVPPLEALGRSGFPDSIKEFGAFIFSSLNRPLHEKATIFFYEGEPYIPDRFLYHLELQTEALPLSLWLDYWERHIEGVKKPGFSAAGRLVEILCAKDPKLNHEAERAAEEVLKKRKKLFDALEATLVGAQEAPLLLKRPVAHLRLLR